jgi:hypothetical protein
MLTMMADERVGPQSGFTFEDFFKRFSLHHQICLVYFLLILIVVIGLIIFLFDKLD